VGRTEWLREAGLTYRDLETEGLFLPVTEARCTYKASARYDDDLEIRTTAALVSPVRIGFDYEIMGPGGLLATGATVHATLDRQGRPIRVPERIKEFIR
jgi:acyl-CoA thioester hydrolase